MRSKTDISTFYKTKKEWKIFTNRSKAVPGFTCFHADNKLTNSEFQNSLSAYPFPMLTRYTTRMFLRTGLMKFGLGRQMLAMKPTLERSLPFHGSSLFWRALVSTTASSRPPCEQHAWTLGSPLQIFPGSDWERKKPTTLSNAVLPWGRRGLPFVSRQTPETAPGMYLLWIFH